MNIRSVGPNHVYKFYPHQEQLTRLVRVEKNEEGKLKKLKNDRKV